MMRSQTAQHAECSSGYGPRFLENLWQMALRARVEDALCLVELRGFEPLTPCMPCHPHPFTTPFAASLATTSGLLGEVVGQGAVVGREAGRGIAADNLLTDRLGDPLGRRLGGHPAATAGAERD
jgi:hypothetical protein